MKSLKIALFATLTLILSACGNSSNQQATNSTAAATESSTTTTATETVIRQTTSSTAREIYATNLFDNLITKTTEDATTTSKTATTSEPKKTVYEMPKPIDCLLTSTDGTSQDVVYRLSVNCLGRPDLNIAENTWVNLIDTNVYSKEYVRDDGFYRSEEATCLRDATATACDKSDGSIDLGDSVDVQCNFDTVTVKYDRMANRLRSLCGSDLTITIAK